MLSFFTRKLTGIAEIKVSGPEKQRLVNLAVKRGIRFWNYRREGEDYLLCLKPGDYRRLREELSAAGKNCQAEISLLRESGLPFRLRPYRRRAGLLLGAVAGILLAARMSGQVWVLGTEGSQRYSETEVLAAAQKAGVYLGAEFREFDPVAAANAILLELPEAEWVSVNTEGVTATVSIRDGIPKPPIYEEEGVKNVVAGRTGVVRSIEAHQGKICVELNEGVKQGQLLISGIWESYNRWGEKTGHTFTAPARGIVMAETRRTFSLELPLRETVYDRAETKERSSLYFFGLTLPLKPARLQNGEYSRETEESPLYLMGTKMPIVLRRERYTRLERRERVLGEQEAREKLLQLLREQQTEALGERGSVLEEETLFETKGELLRLTAECVCLEDIARQVPALYSWYQ